MRNLIALSACVLLLIAAPLGLAGTDSDSYMTGGGVFTDATGGYTLFGCPDRHDHCDLLQDGGRDIPFGIGSVRLTNPDGFAQNVIVRGNDEAYGAMTALTVCVFNPDGDPTVCTSPEDVVSDTTCGTVVSFGWPWLSESVLVGVWSAYIQEDLQFCGATTGTATADFF